jgi:hypothetical protein
VSGSLAHAVAAAVAVVLVPVRAAAAPVPPVSIPSDPRSGLFPQFTGAAAVPAPLPAAAVPASAFMAPNGRSNVHDDPYMSDTYTSPGPLGVNTEELSTYLAPGAECGSVTFDSEGRIVSVCIGLDPSPVIGTTSNVNLVLFDPRTLDLLAAYALPPRTPSTSPFTDFSAGGYFYLDNQDRAVVPTTSRHIDVIAETAAPGFVLVAEYDLTTGCPQADKITSALPDAGGRIWFAAFDGWIGTVDPQSGAVQCLDLAPLEAGHLPPGVSTAEIENSFAVDPAPNGGVYVVSETAMYRLHANSAGAPEVTWQAFYPRVNVKKPGQVDEGSGTTPTLMGGDLVAITDNADPMDILVYRRSDGTPVCTQPVFDTPAFLLPPGSAVTYASDTENSLIGTDTSMVVENNYGYSGPTSTSGGAVTTPGLERVDVTSQGCHEVWLSMERAPSVVAKLSLAAGLVYAYTKPPDMYSPDPQPPAGADPWYLTAIDIRTGATVFSRLSGVGLGYNNNYAPLSLGPDGAAYVGALGGLVEFRDQGPAQSVPEAAAAPELLLPLVGLGLTAWVRRRGRRVPWRRR